MIASHGAPIHILGEHLWCKSSREIEMPLSTQDKDETWLVPYWAGIIFLLFHTCMSSISLIKYFSRSNVVCLKYPNILCNISKAREEKEEIQDIKGFKSTPFVVL